MNPTMILKLVLWLAAAGAVVLVASKLLGRATASASASLP